MHFETKGLPSDVHEIFFSDRFFYASSAARKKSGRPLHVGCGVSRAQAIFDMRQVARTLRNSLSTSVEKQAPPLGDFVQERRTVLDAQRRAQLGERLRALRQGRGLSQLEVSNLALGQAKSHAMVSRLERGALSSVDVRVLDTLGVFFGLSLDEGLQ